MARQAKKGKERLLRESSQSGRPVNNARSINSSRKKNGLVCSAASNICTGCFKFCLCIPPQILLLSNSFPPTLLRRKVFYLVPSSELGTATARCQGGRQRTIHLPGRFTIYNLQFTKHLSDRLTVYNLQYTCQIDWQFTIYNTPVR